MPAAAAPVGRPATKARYTPPPSGMPAPAPEAPPAAPTATSGGFPSPADVDAFLAKTKGVKLTPEALKSMKGETPADLVPPKPQVRSRATPRIRSSRTLDSRQQNTCLSDTRR